jgi:tRNA-2-methylthio-N6-dimethylallyladenosine synthase
MNKADSEYLGCYLERAGCQPAGSPQEADLLVLNSCVVRQSAESKVAHKLDSLKQLKKARPHLTILLTGCMVDSEEEKLRARFPHVDFYFKPQDWESFHHWAETQGFSLSPEGKHLLVPAAPAVSTFVTIIQGCDNFCTYCIVPYRRGREKSRPLEEIRCQVMELVHRGVKEVTLLGQNVDSYGHDLPGKPDLADLLEELNSIEGLRRIRFLTSHPKDMKPKLIQAVAELPKVCEHISLPVQAGDNEILRAMERGYTIEQYRQLIAQIRHTIPDVALSTDVIVGFPGETEAQFQRTVELLQEIRFDTVHVAAYSPRPGTLASRKFKDNVPIAEKKRRLERIEALQQEIAAEINARLLGRTVEILVEAKKKEKWEGRTRTNKLVFFEDSADHCGELVKVRIERASPWALQGKLIERVD